MIALKVEESDNSIINIEFDTVDQLSDYIIMHAYPIKNATIYEDGEELLKIMDESIICENNIIDNYVDYSSVVNNDKKICLITAHNKQVICKYTQTTIIFLRLDLKQII